VPNFTVPYGIVQIVDALTVFPPRDFAGETETRFNGLKTLGLKPDSKEIKAAQIDDVKDLGRR